LSKKIHKKDLQPGETAETRGVLDAEGEAAVVQAPDPLTVKQESARLDEAAAKATAPEAKKKDEASQSPFSVTVGTVYDGPLDLLLDLIRSQDIDIYDIPIARVTKQFLAYVENLKQTDVDSAAEFIYTASLLIHIKSKMLLPRDPSDLAGDTEDPRRELVDRLLEHEKFKSAAQMLMQKQQVEEAVWTNPGMREFHDAPGTEQEFAADTMDLVRVFQEVMNRLRERPILNVDEESVTVAQMLDYVKRRMVMEDKPVSLRRLLHSTHSERALICMFLALLELVRLQAVLLRQQDNFGDILIKKGDGFDAVMSEDAQVRDDWS
jgi:segregation and condensation protein A